MSISLKSIKGGQRMLAPKIVVYGVGGIGKTTFAASAPSPVFIFTEDGQGALDVQRFEFGESAIARSWKDILDSVGALYSEDHGYQTLVIDSIDFAEPMLWEHTCKLHNQKDIEAFGYGKGYTAATDQARQLLAGLDALRNARGMSIILIAHSEAKKFEDPESPAYDQYQLRLHRGFAGLVHDWSDALLFANYKTVVVGEDEGFKKERKRGVGRGARTLYTERRPAFWAKNRYSLPPEIPMSWESFQQNIGASMAPNMQPDALPDETENKENSNG